MYSLQGLGDYNGWCFKFPGQRDTLTVASPGVIAAPGCSNQPPIHCTLYNRTASCTWPAPSIRGLGPFPYWSITTGAPSPPELVGESCPCQDDPLFSRMRSPGRNCEAFALSRVFQGAGSSAP